jgi:hypothetical protein
MLSILLSSNVHIIRFFGLQKFTLFNIKVSMQHIHSQLIFFLQNSFEINSNSQIPKGGERQLYKISLVSYINSLFILVKSASSQEKTAFVFFFFFLLFRNIINATLKSIYLISNKKLKECNWDYSHTVS